MDIEDDQFCLTLEVIGGKEKTFCYQYQLIDSDKTLILKSIFEEEPDLIFTKI